MLRRRTPPARPAAAGRIVRRPGRRNGRWLAFISDRGGDKAQIFVMPTDGGEARQVTHGLKSVGGVVWSPSSDSLAFVARVRPEGVPSIVDSPTPPAVREIDRIKHRFDGSGLLDGRTHLFTVDLAGGEPRQITDGDWDDQQPAWSPDGGMIAFASNRTAGRDWNDESSVYIVPATGGRVRAVTRGGHCPRRAVLVAGRPDHRLHRSGRRRAVVVRTYASGRCRPAGGDPVCLTAGVDLEPRQRRHLRPPRRSSDADAAVDGRRRPPAVPDQRARQRRPVRDRRRDGEPRRLIGGERVLLDV